MPCPLDIGVAPSPSSRFFHECFGDYPPASDVRADGNAGHRNLSALQHWFQAASNGSFPATTASQDWLVKRLHHIACSTLGLVSQALAAKRVVTSESGPPCLSNDSCPTAVRFDVHDVGGPPNHLWCLLHFGSTGLREGSHGELAQVPQ